MIRLIAGIASKIRSLRSGRYWHVALVLLLGVVLTGVFLIMVKNREQTLTEAEFASQANAYASAIQRGIDRNLEVIQSIGGLFASSGKVERDDFRRFVEGPLSRHQEIQALSWNERVTHSERRHFEASLRQEGYPEFQVTERSLDGQRVVAIERSEYIVVTYIEPSEGNEAALGYDVASNPIRLAALEGARDTGEMIATGRITLVQETGNQFGFLILNPIYKIPAASEAVEGRQQDLKGFTVGVFRIGDMIEASLEDLPKGIVNIQLVDNASPADEGLLYLSRSVDSDNLVDEEQFKAQDNLNLGIPLEVPGRQWSLLISPTPEFLGAQDSWEPWGVLAGGLLITTLVVGYLITVINHGAKTHGLMDQLQRSRDYVDGIIRSMVDILIVMNPDATIRFINQASLGLLGYEQDELLGESVSIILAEEEELFVGTQLKEVLARGFVRDFSLAFRTKSAEIIPVFCSGSAMRDTTGELTAIVVVARDMREMNRLLEQQKELAAAEAAAEAQKEKALELEDALKELQATHQELQSTQAQLVQSGKMAGLGKIGAGIAHELNQPITSIQGFAQRLRKRDGSAEMSEELGIIINGTHRMARIVDNIRAFARQGDFDALPTIPVEPLDDALMLLSEQLRLHGVEVKRTVEEDLPRILADKIRLQQVFFNLLGNALDALDEVQEGRPKLLQLGLERDGNQVLYTVEDSGPGIPDANRSQIFDPFFTTKPVGKGIGLGLSLSYGIVADHGGELAYRPSASGGALFTVRIPLAPLDAKGGSKKPVASGERRRKG